MRPANERSFNTFRPLLANEAHPQWKDGDVIVLAAAFQLCHGLSQAPDALGGEHFIGTRKIQPQCRHVPFVDIERITGDKSTLPRRRPA